MKNRRLLPLLVCASLFTAFGSSVFTPLALAQPAAGAGKMNKKGRAKGAATRGGAKRGGVPKRMMEKIETQMGKPLTEDQKMRLNTAYKARMDAQKAAQAKFADEVVTVTGLTAEQVKDLNKRGPRAGGAAAKPAQN